MSRPIALVRNLSGEVAGQRNLSVRHTKGKMKTTYKEPYKFLIQVIKVTDENPKQC